MKQIQDSGTYFFVLEGAHLNAPFPRTTISDGNELPELRHGNWLTAALTLLEPTEYPMC